MDKESLVVVGELPGEIAGIPRGENGFGYDPLFFVPEYNKTVAEMTSEEKNKISHRAQAIQKLVVDFKKWMEE